MSRSPSAVQRLMRLLAWVRRPEFLVFLPAITLAGFWMGGERVLLLLAVGLPLLFSLSGPSLPVATEGREGPVLARVIGTLDAVLPGLATSGRSTACLVIRFDDPGDLLDRHGRAAQQSAAQADERSPDALADALIALERNRSREERERQRERLEGRQSDQFDLVAAGIEFVWSLLRR